MLQRHTQSMSSARERLEQELALEERRTLALQQQLQAVRQALTASFASLPVPGAQPRPHLRSRPHFLLGPAPMPHQVPPRPVHPIHRTRMLRSGLTHGTPLNCVFGPAPSQGQLPGPAQLRTSGPPLTNPLTRRHWGDADAGDTGLLHGAASRSHRARPRAARETDRARQGDPGAGSQVRGVGGESGVKGERGSARGLHHPLCPTASTCDRPLGPGDAPPHPPRKKLHLGVSRPPSNKISTASL